MKPFHICYVANVRLSTEKAHGIQIMKMCEAFAKEEAQVTLLVPRRINPIKADPFKYYSVRKDLFAIERLPVMDFILLDRILGKLALWLEQMTFALFARRYLKKAKSQFDIIYTRDFFLAKFLLGMNAPIVLEAHEFPKHPSWYLKSWKKLHSIFVLTSHLKEAFVGAGVDEGHIHIAPDAVDLEAFTVKESKERARRELGLPENEKIVMYTGHLYEWKGAGLLADAAEKLSENVRVVLVGGTKQDIAVYFQKYKNVTITHYVPHRRIPLYLRAADILVLPNRGNVPISAKYTSTLKRFEYMASGVPIVASDLLSIREVLNETNAVLFVPDNKDSLVQSIQKVLTDPELAKSIAQKARHDVQKYSWARRARGILEFITL